MAFLPIVPIIAFGTAAAIAVYKTLSKSKERKSFISEDVMQTFSTNPKEQKSVTPKPLVKPKEQKPVNHVADAACLARIKVPEFHSLLNKLKERELLEKCQLDFSDWPEDFLKNMDKFKIPYEMLKVLMPEFEKEFEKELEICSVEDILFNCNDEVKDLLEEIKIIPKIKSLYDEHSESIISLKETISSLKSSIYFCEDKEFLDTIKHFESILKNIMYIVNLKDYFFNFFNFFNPFIEEIIEEQSIGNFYSKYTYLGHCPYGCLSSEKSYGVNYSEPESKRSFKTKEGTELWFKERNKEEIKKGKEYEACKCHYGGEWWHYKTKKQIGQED